MIDSFSNQENSGDHSEVAHMLLNISLLKILEKKSI